MLNARLGVSRGALCFLLLAGCTPKPGTGDDSSSNGGSNTGSSSSGQASSGATGSSSAAGSSGSSVCPETCTEGDTTCEGTDSFRVCGMFGADGCPTFSVPVACGGGRTCVNGACQAPCADECPVGTAACSPAGEVLTCGNFDADDCRELGGATLCQPAHHCESGACVPDGQACADECATDGQMSCFGDATRECGHFDADPCLDLGAVTACRAGETCGNGICAATCLDECPQTGASECSGAGTRTCGQYDADNCREWSSVTPCGGGTSCSNGTCSASCTDECAASGATQCESDGSGVRTCGQYDVDGCLDLSSKVPCGSSETCTNGACQPVCTDDCTSGAKRCAPTGNGVETCGSYDADACLEWGGVLACTTGTCANGACPSACTDECTAAQTQCDGTTAVRTCGNYDTDSCLELSSPSSCNGGESCSNGMCAPPSNPGVVINQLCYDAAGTDTDPGNTLMIELWGPPGLVLAGWALAAVDGANGNTYRTLALDSYRLGADGYLILAASNGAASLLAVADATLAPSSLDLQNGPDSVVLTVGGSAADALGYDTFSATLLPNNRGEGTPAADAASGACLKRNAQHQDTGNNATDFSVVSAPAPGRTNSVSSSSSGPSATSSSLASSSSGAATSSSLPAAASSAAPSSSTSVVVGDVFMGPFKGIPAIAVSARQVAVADFNGDGRLDVAMAGSRGPQVSLTMSNGFPGPVVALSQESAHTLVALDANQDSRPDLVVLEGLNLWAGLNLYLNDGAGGFPAATPLGSYRSSATLVTTDWNADGRADLLVMHTDGTNTYVCLSNGNGTFAACNVLSVVLLNRGAVADVTGDGHPDLVGTVTHNGQSELATFPGSSGGVGAPIYSGPQSGEVGLADVDGDTRLDAVLRSGTNVWLRTGQVGGGFGAQVTAGQVESAAYGSTVVLADLNADGLVELVHSGSTQLAVITFNANGTLRMPVPVDSGWGGPAHVVVKDMNGDGRLDLVAASGVTQWLLGRGDLTFTREERLPATNARHLRLVDADADGTLDLLLTTVDGPGATSGSFQLFKGNAALGFPALPTLSVALTGGRPERLAVGDVNNDGRVDVVVAAETSSGWVLLQQATGQFTLVSTRLSSSMNASAGLEMFSFDGDNVLDLAVASGPYQEAAVLLGNGNGTFSEPIFQGLPDYATGLAVADMNGDTRLDLVTGSFGDVFVMANQGSGVLAARARFNTQNAYHSDVAAADMDADGALDVVATDYVRRELALLRGRGDGTSLAVQVSPAPGPDALVRLRDMDGDARPDAVVWIPGGVAGVMVNDGFRNLLYPPAYSAGACGPGMAVGDLNADGKLDLVLVGGTSYLAVLRGR